jgi:hypothetical protein
MVYNQNRGEVYYHFQVEDLIKEETETRSGLLTQRIG